jgi:hypothetical protein
MVGIQYTLRICAERLTLALSLLMGFQAHSQQDKVVLNLRQDNAPLYKQTQFYIQEVEDKRKLFGASIGKIIVFGKETPLSLPRTAERELFSYWTNSIQKGGHAYLPLYITIQDLYLTEKRIGPNRVNGDAKLKVTFRWYRNMQPVELTNFETSVSYGRTEKEYDHGKLVTQMLDQSITHFQKWMVSNQGKSPSLARNLILTFREMTGSNNGDTVFYSPKRPLVWDDFRGKGRVGTRYAAAVFTSFAYEGRSFPKGADLILEIGLKIFMVKSMSWGNSDARNANTIRHEQLHFDVTRIVVERFKERLKKADLTIEDFDSELQYQFLESFREMNQEQESYDGETSHGINAGAQAQWDRKITAEIEKIYSTQ